MRPAFLKLYRTAHRFRDARNAVSAVEFALTFPLFVLLLLVGFESVRYINITRQMTYLASSMATMITERTNAVNGNDVLFAFNSALVTFPQVLSDPARGSAPWTQYLSLTLSSVVFTPTVAGCTSNCTYTANVAWSLGTVATRSCLIPPTPTSDVAPPSLLTLPQDAYTAGSVIVADVVYPFVPVFASRLMPSLVLRRSVYLQPRYLGNIPMTKTGGPYGGCV